MEYQSILKDNSWIDAIHMAEWLNISDSKMDVRSQKADLVVGDLTFTFKTGGIEGNAFSIELTTGGTAGSEVVTQDADKLSVQIEDGVSTAQEIFNAITAFAAIPNTMLVDFVISGTAGNPQAIAAIALLTGGIDPNSKNSKTVRKIEKLINYACAKIESIIDTNVLPQTFVENLDGNLSNVIQPTHWPVQSITELRLDYNRNFPDATVVNVSNYFLRGTPDKRQRVTDTSIRIVGTDIVLRDDDEQYIIGRVFAGSVLGSILLTYVAGWTNSVTRGTDSDTAIPTIDAIDLPQDMVLAATQLTEWFYYQRENRDLGVSGKGVVGENYTKTTDGIPNQIHQLIEQYVDLSFGQHNQPQRNTWGI